MSRHCLLYLVVIMVGCSGERSSLIGVNVDQLRPCPDSLNCVSSQSSDLRHAIAPIQYEGTAENARELLIKVVWKSIISPQSDPPVQNDPFKMNLI